mgnify:CR=1 FL=1
MEPILKGRGLVKRYGKVTALDHCDFDLYPGEILAVIGDNGAGKSFGHPGDTLGFSATGTLNRSDFGLTYLSNFGIGDEVTLRIEAEFNEKQ